MGSGPEETRTPDLYSAIVALSQLSYRPQGGGNGNVGQIDCQVSSNQGKLRLIDVNKLNDKEIY